jgi:hypothetical protein
METAQNKILYIYIYVMQHYSAIKKNEILSFTGKCMELKSIMLSEISQVQKDIQNTKSKKISEIIGKTDKFIIMHGYRSIPIRDV